MVGHEMRGQVWSKLEEGASLLLTGDAGVGKSSLAAGLLDHAASLGWSTQLIAATPAVQTVSFGAVHELLSTEKLDHVALLNLAIETLQERAAGRRQLIVVDDINSLDAESLALVDRLARTTGSTILATVRSSNVDDLRLTSLWKDGILEHVNVPPFTRTTTDELVKEMLNGPVSKTLLDETWELTQGNALFVRELLLGAQDQGRIAKDAAGKWQATDRLAMTNRLFGIIANRLDGLEAEVLDALVIVACSEPIDLVALDDVAEQGAIETLELKGFLTIAGARPGRTLARVAHPMIGEILREGTSRARRRSLLGKLGEQMLIRSRSLDPDNRQRALMWALDAGVEFDRQLLLPAAERALFRFDIATAAHLSAPALEFVPTSRAAQILSRSHFLAKRYDEAAEAAQRGMTLAETEEDRCVLLVAWADIEMFGRSRFESGIVRLRHELPTFELESSRAEIEMRIAVGAAFTGEVLETIDSASEHVEDEAMPLAARVHVLAGLHYAMLMSGKSSSELLERINAGMTLTNDDPEFWVHNLLLKLLQLLGEIQRCELDAATRAATTQASLALDASEQAGWSLIPALAAAAGGSGRDAIAAGERSAELLAQSDPYGVELWGVGIAALGHARQGNVDIARGIVETIEPCQLNSGRLGMFARLGQSWLHLHEGEEERAIEVAIAAADAASAEEHFFFASLAAHEVARMGHSAAVVDRLASWAAIGEAPLMVLYADHARALHLSDAEMLERVGRNFVDSEAPALAAEAFASAARTSTCQRARLLTLAQALAASAGWEHSITMAVSDFLLSERELEVAQAAARGLTNKEIASELFLSFRTVGNHLHAVYRKLGFSTRSELSRYLSVNPERVDPATA